jgi:hypothetical protein
MVACAAIVLTALGMTDYIRVPLAWPEAAWVALPIYLLAIAPAIAARKARATRLKAEAEVARYERSIADPAGSRPE